MIKLKSLLVQKYIDPNIYGLQQLQSNIQRRLQSIVDTQNDSLWSNHKMQFSVKIDTTIKTQPYIMHIILKDKKTLDMVLFMTYSFKYQNEEVKNMKLLKVNQEPINSVFMRGLSGSEKKHFYSAFRSNDIVKKIKKYIDTNWR